MAMCFSSAQGNDVMNTLGVPKGPKVGELMNKQVRSLAMCTRLCNLEYGEGLRMFQLVCFHSHSFSCYNLFST